MAEAAFRLIEPVWRIPAESRVRAQTSVANVELVPLPDLGALEADWTALQTESEHSFFQSWGWIGTWLRWLPRDIQPLLLRVRQGSEILGLAAVTEATVWRRGLIRSRTAFVNETGRADIDKLSVEHNGVLARNDRAREVERLALNFLRGEIANGRWHEVVLAGVHPSLVDAAEDGSTAGPSLLVRRRDPSHIVDFDALRKAGGGIPDVFRQSLRKDIRRAMRRAESLGPLKVEEARSADEALRFLYALIPLHEARWSAAGQIGAFSNPWLRRFHARLVADRFAAGEIQLLRVTIGDDPIGYLYNFSYRGRLYGYQWGLARHPDRQIKVGLLCDALALQHNLARGAQIFDFLHGDSEYKRRFATGSEERVWLVLQQRRIDFRVENALRDFRRRQGWSTPLA